jgi:hypothetical protein
MKFQNFPGPNPLEIPMETIQAKIRGYAAESSAAAAMGDWQRQQRLDVELNGWKALYNLRKQRELGKQGPG